MTTRKACLALTLVLAALAVAVPQQRSLNAQSASRPAPAHAPATALINAELRLRWRKAKVRPAARAGDAEFLRRASLDLIGRIPTADEVDAFLSDPRSGKRALAVDRLLSTADYAEHWANVYMDLTIGRELRRRGRIIDAVRPYFVNTFANNRPVDRLVTELVSSTGDFELDPAAIYNLSFYARGKDQAQQAGTTARIFLGQQIQCAQCHDHPNDKRYKRADFGAFAAFFSRLTRRAYTDPLFGPVIETYETEDAPSIGSYRNRPAFFVPPRFLGSTKSVAATADYLPALAQLVRAAPSFAMTTVNRTWHQLFGRALSGRWDDLGSPFDARHPALLGRLARDFASTGYDHKRLLKAIVLSEAYQRTSAKVTKRQRAVFAGAAVRPLSADQLLRSQLLATGYSRVIQRQRGPDGVHNFEHQMLGRYLFVFGDDAGEEVDTFSGSVAQALLLRNHTLTNQGARATPSSQLQGILNSHTSPAQRIRRMFISAYGRPPTAAESTRYVGYLRKHNHATAGYEDLFHALLTSTEFLSNH